MKLAEYQRHAVDCFLRVQPRKGGIILEVGSDLEARVVRALAEVTGGEVIGINPNPSFPILSDGLPMPNGTRLLREDGRRLSLPDESVDAVFTVATVEHVLGLDDFYTEIRRVLKPGGVLHADFGPIWSCHMGHHSFAVVGKKEARYWKPGRNPVPDFAHLLWSPEEMQRFLSEGPCDDSLVQPLVDWIYFQEGINRCFLEDHLAALRRSGMWCQRLGKKIGVPPDPMTAAQLRAKYGGAHDFTVFGLEATLRKPGGRCTRLGTDTRRRLNTAKDFGRVLVRALGQGLRQFTFFRQLLDRRHVK